MTTIMRTVRAATTSRRGPQPKPFVVCHVGSSDPADHERAAAALAALLREWRRAQHSIEATSQERGDEERC